MAIGAVAATATLTIAINEEFFRPHRRTRMPLPFIVWAAIAAGGAYVAWKNKDTIMETLNEVGKEIYAKEEKEVEQLLAMPVDQALKVIELNVGSKDIFQWGAFKNLLLKKSHESVQAKALLVKATEVWESANPELAKGN